MRWLFLLLLVLNVFYYIWHQQEAPLRAKDVTPLSLYRGSQQDIRLLSEATDVARDKGKAAVGGQWLPLSGRLYSSGGRAGGWASIERDGGQVSSPCRKLRPKWLVIGCV